MMVQVSTDLKLPEDLDEVGIVVLRNGVTVIRQSVPVDPKGDLPARIPGTFAVTAGSDPDAVLTFRVFGVREGKIRITREAVTAIPRARTSVLRMPLHLLCDGEVKTVKNENDDDVPEDKRRAAPPRDRVSTGSS